MMSSRPHAERHENQSTSEDWAKILFRVLLRRGTDNKTASSNYRFLYNLKKTCDGVRKTQIEHYLSTRKESSGLRRVCLPTFDGWSCWNMTPVGETAVAPCPYFVTGFDQSRFAFRRCLENGSWFRHPDTGQPWSNYTTCIDIEDLEFRKLVNTIYVIGYYISFAALVVSLIIFLAFRSLRCTRIAIHVHLFTSFAANNLMWIIWYKLVVGNTTVVQENQMFCQVMHVVLQYLMVANYMWMFIEGLHLHLALVVVFVKDDSAMRWFYFIGWLLPAALTIIYAVVRSSYPDETRQCWMNDSHTQWILTVPVCLSMLASLAFLVNVVRVLLTKLHCNSANPAPIGLRKAVRAAFILVPLFGIHHILIPFRPEPHEPGERIYQVFSALLVSLQGFCVSVLFCFANVDVHCAFKASARRMRRRRATETGNMTGTQTREKDEAQAEEANL
ncbi:HormR [Nesidiocoris tenuis]|uniref:HormR n=1 Tax=Nesidiocoris tenuis TaxID=355587 RepID=A0ABN7AQI5_9HEMI|nr:HormR [Nesidiocoris tenuis]